MVHLTGILPTWPTPREELLCCSHPRRPYPYWCPWGLLSWPGRQHEVVLEPVPAPEQETPQSFSLAQSHQLESSGEYTSCCSIPCSCSAICLLKQNTSIFAITSPNSNLILFLTLSLALTLSLPYLPHYLHSLLLLTILPVTYPSGFLRNQDRGQATRDNE